MSEIKQIFFYFLRQGLWGNREKYKYALPAREEWKLLFTIAHSQAVTGIFIDGVACTSMRPDRDLWEQWVGHLLHIEQMNAAITRCGNQWLARLQEAGISASLFKGTSVATWYPCPQHRSYGDIDLVVEKGWNKLEHYLQTYHIPYRNERGDIVLQEKYLSVEFHPQWEYLYNPLINNRLQRMLQTSTDISHELYLTCLILHLRRHFLTYGIGLKQVCDVAVMLHSCQLDHARLAYILRQLHVEKFSRALFGFIASGIGHPTNYPLSPLTSGRTFALFQNIILHDGYFLKIKQEKTATLSRFPVIRIARNVLFWTKRCFRLSSIMPGEAFFFLLHMTNQRIKALFR